MNSPLYYQSKVIGRHIQSVTNDSHTIYRRNRFRPIPAGVTKRNTNFGRQYQPLLFGLKFLGTGWTLPIGESRPTRRAHRYRDRARFSPASRFSISPRSRATLRARQYDRAVHQRCADGCTTYAINCPATKAAFTYIVNGTKNIEIVKRTKIVL